MNEEAKASLLTRLLKLVAGTGEQKKYWATLFGTLGVVSVTGSASIAFALKDPRVGLGTTGVACGIILAGFGALFLRSLKVSKEPGQ